MFSPDIYINRRNRLAERITSGIVLLMGNEESPMNYPDNTYPFRQDSTFLYFFGLDMPHLAGIIDIDNNTQTIFGDDLTIDEIIWTKPPPPMSVQSEEVGISQTASYCKLAVEIEKALKQKRKIHFLPQYRAENIITLSQMLGMKPAEVNNNASVELIKAVANLRQYKSPEEIARIQMAVEITTKMHITAMKTARPGLYERQVVAAMQEAITSEGYSFSFPPIFTIHGQTLHNLDHSNLMKTGDIVVNDSGAECPMHYAADITRTIPIGGKFTQKQKEIYSIVLDAEQKAIDAVKPGVEFRDIHILACRTLAAGLKDLGLMKGDADAAVAAGAHALFFQCGLGHMMGLDTHDMEDIGEDFVGYTPTIKRNPQFGLCSLRLAKPLEEDFVITIEPGIYFIPQLIDMWQAENKYEEFINYNAVEKYKDFGGIRIEDDVLVTKTGNIELSRSMPKTIREVESLASS